ncbi:universal stress protein [Fulvivirga sediminis]|uniref:Universal stress protein n=1 Tax=Fulvivirga sediminis TaxID=2803949 RepID=A0A937JXT8_9BACT|nr:universal stress protein [Fulvivirga sediminis]MBL3655793.1 universal stress protein [Fulvivirga sediminis]
MFKRIIYPTDFSESSIRCLSVALDIAIAHGGELIILHAYRLITGSAQESIKSKIQFKREQEAAANIKFERLKSFMPEIEQVNNTFLAEVGFVKERLFSAIDTFDVDLVVLCEDIQKKLQEKWDLNEDNDFNKFKCPVMFIPSSKVLVK